MTKLSSYTVDEPLVKERSPRYTPGLRQASTLVASVAYHWPAVQRKMSHLRRFPVSCTAFGIWDNDPLRLGSTIQKQLLIGLKLSHKFCTWSAKCPRSFVSWFPHSNCNQLTVKTTRYHIFGQTQIMPLVKNGWLQPCPNAPPALQLLRKSPQHSPECWDIHGIIRG